jgi:hypothetical protein
MRNNVPGGDFSALVPPADVEERAGGLTGRVLIEQLRASIRALEQVPVSLSIPPAPGAAPSLPACSLTPPSSVSGSADAPSQSPPSNNPLSTLHQAGLHEIKPHAYRDTPAGLGLALSVIADIQRQGPGAVLWCMTQRQAQEWGRPYGPGLLKAGLDPARVLFVEMRNADEIARQKSPARSRAGGSPRRQAPISLSTQAPASAKALIHTKALLALPAGICPSNAAGLVLK